MTRRQGTQRSGELGAWSRTEPSISASAAGALPVRLPTDRSFDSARKIIVHGNLTLGSQVRCPRTMITRRSGVRAQTITILRCPGTNGHNAAVSAHNDHPTAGGGVPFRVISRCSSPWGGCCWQLAGTGQGGRAAPAACRRCCAAPAATEPPGSVSAVRDGEPGQGLPLGGESRSSGRAMGLTEQWASRSWVLLHCAGTRAGPNQPACC